MQTALAFPGQGSQSVMMLNDFYHNFSYVKDLVNNANDILGYDLWSIMQEDADKLSQTIYTQSAMLIAGVASYQVLSNETNIQAEALAGHSLGEISALVAANVIDFASAVKIVNMRANLMQKAVPVGSGAMAAILGLEDETVIKICNNSSAGIVEPVNFNSPGQIVIAGEKLAVEQICEELKQQGAKRAVILPVSVPSHSSLMTDAAKDFLTYLQDFSFNSPQITLLHNIDAQAENDPENIKQKISKQLCSPVLWSETINKFTQKGINNIIEVGPGKVLTGLNKRINKAINTSMVFDLKTLEGINVK